MLALVCAAAASALPGALLPLTAVPGPAVSAVDPASAANDIDTTVTITGADFAADVTETVPPQVWLGDTALTNVMVVDSATLTAMVPWGIDPGS